LGKFDWDLKLKSAYHWSILINIMDILSFYRNIRYSYYLLFYKIKD